MGIPQGRSNTHGGRHERARPGGRFLYGIVAVAAIAISPLAYACGDSTDPDQPTGVVRVAIEGFVTAVSSAGSATITGTGIDPITVQLPGTVSGTARVPVGDYHVVYQPPAGYTMAVGESNEADVTVEDNDTVDVVFNVMAASGALRIAVDGLADDAGAGGSASVLRTDVTGGAPITVIVPDSGTNTISLAPGSYQVTYTAPLGYALAAGQTSQRGATVESEEQTTVTFVVEEVPIAADVVFASDFSTGTGSSNGVLRDTAGAFAWQLVIGSGNMNEVISTGHDLPTANALHVVGVPNEALDGVNSQNLRTESIPIPAVGQSLYYRWYFAVTLSDSIVAAPGGHPIQDANGGGSTNWMMNTAINNDGTWNYSLQTNGGETYPHTRFELDTPLEKDRVYRFEHQILRVSATHFNMHVRIYDESVSPTVPVFDDDDFIERDGNGSLAEVPTIRFNDVQLLSGFQIGTNGPRNAWTGLQAGVGVSYYMQGGVCIRTDDWCGPYANGL